MTRRYHQLLASLPHIARFDRLKALPIGRERFESRLAMLEPLDSVVVAWLRAGIWPERKSLQQAAPLTGDPSDTARALADRAAAIRRAFAARSVDEDPVELERERLGAIWDSAERLTCPYGLGLDALLRVMIRWDVATAWLAGDPERSGERIEALAHMLIQGWSHDGRG